MPSAEDCRNRAIACRDQAERAFEPVDKAAWLRIAADWTKLAQSYEQPADGLNGAINRLYGLKQANRPQASGPRRNSHREIPIVSINRAGVTGRLRLSPTVGAWRRVGSLPQSWCWRPCRWG
jgi:hypothetical protein